MRKIITETSPAFFLGANTPEGFLSLFSELYFPEDGWRLYILKGGPGTGKSSVMKKTAAAAEKRGAYCERIYCSSDPASLDAVILPGLRVSVADGTPPHVIEPRFPGVSEKFVDLGAYRDDGRLAADRDAVIAATLENSLEHKKCVGFLKAAETAVADSRYLIGESTDALRLKQFAVRLADSLLPTGASRPGVRRRRFLNAPTPAGMTVFYETAASLCEKKVVLDDAYGVCAPVILRILSDRAVKAGLTVTECPCALRGGRTLSHLLIPELSLGIFTDDAHTDFGGDADKTVRCARFTAPGVFRDHKNRLAFNAKAYGEFTAEAVKKLAAAKAVHDELEKYYIAAMDFDGVRERTDRLIEEIFAPAGE